MTENVLYEVTGRDGEIEFRRYPALMLATVDDPGDDSGFRALFSYIYGNNRSQGRIRMTAPVISDTLTMSFVMPHGKDKNELPEPVDPRVRLHSIPQREMAVIRFKGSAGKEEVASWTLRLMDCLKKRCIPTAGRPILMRYNAPWTPGFLRRKEVAVEVIRPAASVAGST